MSKMELDNNGNKFWKNNKDELHREDGPAVIWRDKLPIMREWYINGKPHREDGSAIEYANGDKSWYINGKLHREDGPAIDWNNIKQWWYNGEKLNCTTQEEFERLIRLELFW